MTAVLQLAVMDVGKSVAGVAVARALNLPEMLKFGDSFAMRNISNGSLYFVVSDAINGVTGTGSKIMQYDVRGILDDISFFSVSSGIAEKSGTDTDLYQMLQNTLKTSPETSAVIAESAIVSGTRFLADYIDSQPSLPSFIHIVRHPVSYLSGMTGH